MMEINRRALIGATALSLLGMVYPVLAERRYLYASTRRNSRGQYSASVFDIQTGDIVSVDLPGRGHDVAINHVRREAVAFARRPGDFAVTLPFNKKKKPVWFRAGKGRHFYGHGVFSANGKLLYSTENDYENGVGVIGIRDATNGYEKVGEFSSYGTGPHDLAFLPDRRTLVIANGGIQTHPDAGRQILNRAEMKPNLCYLDSKSGQLLEKLDLGKELHQLSIRHLDVGADGTVVFGCQFKGPSYERPALVGFHKRGRKVVMSQAPDRQHVGMDNYVGSVSCDSSGTIAATSSPKGGIVTFWDIGIQRYLGSTSLIDVCGVAAGDAKTSFLLTSGRGDIRPTEIGSMLVPHPDLLAYQWDNHIIKL